LQLGAMKHKWNYSRQLFRQILQAHRGYDLGCNIVSLWRWRI